MIGILPVIVVGGVAKKFSEGMLGGSRKAARNVHKVRSKRGRTSASRSRTYPSSSYSPF